MLSDELGKMAALLVFSIIILIAFAGWMTEYADSPSPMVFSSGQIVSSDFLTVDKSGLDWGTLEPGGEAVETMRVTNVGSNSVVLLFETSGWQPADASDFLGVSWNYSGKALTPNHYLPLAFTLTVNENIKGIERFNFSITISGTVV